MLTEKYDSYSGLALQPIAEKIWKENYITIESIIDNAKAQCRKITLLEASTSAHQYVSLCDVIVIELGRYISDRVDKYIPYIQELSQKVQDRHNCTHCSGGCKVNHDMYVVELSATNESMKRLLARLQMIALPLYAQTMFPYEYKLLRSIMAMLEVSLAELFFLENNYLVPKITEAQKSINAGDK
jgi:hypothetical protein